MKIMICGSLAFASHMVKMKKELEALRHEVKIPIDTEKFIEDPAFSDNLEEDLKHCMEEDILKKDWDNLAQSDAILVLNYEKNGVKGYVGTSVLMEIGLAYYLEKKIFLLNQFPDMNEHRSSHEIAIINPTIINGDLSKIE